MRTVATLGTRKLPGDALAPRSRFSHDRGQSGSSENRCDWQGGSTLAWAALVPLCLPGGALLLCSERPDEVPCKATTPEAKEARRKLLMGASPIVQLMIGDAIGDAFGLGIEMGDAYWIRRNVTFDKWNLRPNQHRLDWNKILGMYSDDAEMTVGLMKALVRHGRSITIDQMLTMWKEEWDLSLRRPAPCDAGMDTPDGVKRVGHGSIRKYWGGKITIDELRQAQGKKEDPGNAPPMRALPLGFLGDAELDSLAAANADATHAHPKARAASFLVACAARFLVVKGGSQDKVISHCLAELRKTSSCREPQTEELLAKMDALPDWHTYGDRFAKMPVKVHNMICGPQPIRADKNGTRCGLDSDAMRTAAVVLYVVKWQRTPLDALAASIDVGGDVDSTAALVLGIVGGSKGLNMGEPDGIPWWMVEELEGVEYLVARAKEFESWLCKEKLWIRG